MPTMKFSELKVEQLKKELSKLELPTAGNKAELQRRLMENFHQRNIEISTFEFENADDNDVSMVEEASGVDFTAVLACFMKKIESTLQDNSRDLKETSRVMNEKLDANSRIMQENTAATSDKLEEISEVINKRVDHVDIQMEELDRKIMLHDERFLDLEKKMSDLKIKGGPVQVVSENAIKMKTPTFDGSTSFEIFKFQFEMVAGRNLWSDDDKAIELILSLKGVAAEVLQAIPIGSRKNYGEVISALQRKYGGEYKQDVYRMELRGRVQKLNETLQDFATEVERLTILTYPGEMRSFGVSH